jgi:hypothetical protein
VYSSPDTTTADIYLTDLASGALDPATPLAELSGRIVHLHLFVVPLAGSTPMRDTACSVTVRHIVMAKGSIGVYSGGGYLNPSVAHGSDLAGTVRGATLRLTGAAGAFKDRLGPATLEARFTAQRDEATARQVRARVDEVLAAVAAPVSPPTAAPATGGPRP